MITLWTGENESIDLGPTIEGMEAVKEFTTFAAVAEFPDLFGCVFNGDEEVSADYLAKVREQAAAFFERFGDQVSEHGRWMLEQLKG